MLPLLHLPQVISKKVIMLLLNRMGLVTGPGYALQFSGASIAQANITYKYGFSNNLRTAGTALNTVRLWTCGIGTSAAAIIAGGSTTTAGATAVSTSDKYIHATNAVVNQSAGLATARSWMISQNNGTVGIFVGGLTTSSVQTNIVDVYTFATNTVVAGTAITTAEYRLRATGNATVAIMTSYTSASTSKYTYSGNTSAAGTSLPAARAVSGGLSTPTYGLFCGGSVASASSTTVDKYTFSGDTLSTGTNLTSSTTANTGLTGAGNTVLGLIFGTSTAVQRYNYAASTVISMSSGPASVSGVSSTPGHF